MPLVRNKPEKDNLSHHTSGLQYCVNYTHLAYFTLDQAQEFTPIDQEQTINKTHSFVSSLLSKGTELYTQYVEPHLSKENLDNYIVSTISFTTYYGMMPSISQVDNAVFAKRTGVSMRFKLFNTFVNPAISQFVESFTEVNIKNAKYTYYSARCLFEQKYCDELKIQETTFFQDFNSQKSLIQDFTQFNFSAYYNDMSKSFEKLSLSGLFSSGTISATASEIKDFTYSQTGFDQYCQTNFCKNWVSYYYKEWLKSEVKSVFTSVEKNHEHHDSYIKDSSSFKTETTQDKQTAIQMHEVIDFSNTTPITDVVSIQSPFNVTNLQTPILPLIHLPTIEVLI